MCAAEGHLELRKAVRYSLDLPVTFRWPAPSGQDHLGVGFTRDISSAALFVLSEQCPPRDAYVSCEVMLARPSAQRYCQLFASGRVLRIELNSLRRVFGFALLSDVVMLDSELLEARSQALGVDLKACKSA